MIDKVWTETHFRRGAKRGWAPQVGLRWCSGALSGVLGCNRTYDASQMADNLFGDIAPGALLSVWANVWMRVWRIFFFLLACGSPLRRGGLAPRWFQPSLGKKNVCHSKDTIRRSDEIDSALLVQREKKLRCPGVVHWWFETHHCFTGWLPIIVWILIFCTL